MISGETMRTENQIRKQLRQVLYRHLQRKLRVNFKIRPHTCRHNQPVQVGGLEVGTCGHPQALDRDEAPSVPYLCDARCLGGVQGAKDCPWWAPAASKDDVKTEFRALIKSGDRGSIAAEYPDVAALTWALDDDSQEINLLDILSDESEI